MRTLRTASLVLALSLAGLGAAACETTHLFPGDPEQQFPEDTEWLRGQPFSAPSFDVVWQRAQEVLAGEGYRPDEVLTSVSTGEIVTTWITRVAPTRYEGKRRRAHLRIEPVGETQWRVAVAVIRQRNADIDDPKNPLSAQWEADGIDTSRSELLLWKMEYPFREPATATSTPPAIPVTPPGK